MPLKFGYSYVAGEFKKATEEMQGKIAAAATAAVKEAGDTAQLEGRADIASAGFSARWQQALRADMINPKPGQAPTINAATLIHHRIGFASIFETGSTISGKPLLWLPIEKNLPPGRWTPRKYASRFGPLRSVNVPGHPPMLVSRTIKRDAASIARLKTAGRDVDQGGTPVFVGITSVTIRRRFHITEIVKRAASRLSDFYFKNLKP